ncbi:MAG: hypothetical protein M1831_003967 [Alyxoria varia]|nr:MAG: hypothetical protein M1831_003967 [Alyxoria varia]
MSHAGYRGRDNDLAYGDDYARPAERWDREKFERVRARSRGPPRISDSRKYEDDDHFGRGGDRRDFKFEEKFDDRSPRNRFDERDRVSGSRYETPPRRPDFAGEDRSRGRSGHELAPYKDRFDQEPSPRPGYAIRQPDPYYRATPPQYDDQDQNQNGMKVSLRVGSPHDSHQDGPRSHASHASHADDRKSVYKGDEYRHDDRSRGAQARYRDDDYYRKDNDRWRNDEQQYRDIEIWDDHGRGRGYPWRDQGYDDHREPRVVREVEREIERRAPSRDRSRYHESRESDSFEEISRSEVSHHSDHRSKHHSDHHSKHHSHHSPPQKQKRGKTRMPKRLVQKRAILELGYPFEEEDDFYFVLLALNKEQIDEVINMSEKYKQEITFVQKHEQTKAIEAPPPPPQYYEPPPPEVVETVTAKVIENPTEEDYARYGQQMSDHRSDHGFDHTAHGSHVSHQPYRSDAPKSLAPSRVSHRGRSSSVHEAVHSSHHHHKGHSSRSSSSSTHKGAGDDQYAVEKRHHDHKPDELVLEHREKSRGPARRSKSHRRRARSKSSSSSDTHKRQDEYAIEKRHRDHKPDELVMERRDKSRGAHSRKQKHHHHHDDSDDDGHVDIERRHGRRDDHDDNLVFKKRHHSRRPSRRERDDDYVYEERVEESGTIGGPLTLLSSNPNRPRKDNRDINTEIRMLEDERQALKKERKTADRDRDRDDDYEIVERRPRGTSNVRLGKDRSGRLNLVRSND